MIYTPDDIEAFDQMVADSWVGTSSTSVAAAALATMLLDAEAGGVEWAKHRLHEALLSGTARMCKAHRKPKARTSRGPVALTAGVIDASTGDFVQLSLLDLSAEQIDQALNTRTKQLKAASRNARVLRNAKAMMDRHPTALTLGSALTAEGMSLDELLAA